jgi:hypothetical protein
LHGNVDAGIGTPVVTPVVNYFVDASGQANAYHEFVSGSGIVATTLQDPSKVSGSPVLPGNIDVRTPEGDIVANQGGILQKVENGTLTPGPSVTLVAGTRPSDGSPGFVGNIECGNAGVIGGTVNLDASGDITGLVISKQDVNLVAGGSFSGTILANGSANLSAGGGIGGPIIGVGGVNASGGQGVTATIFSPNASVNGAQGASTFASSTPATSAAQSASQQSTSDAKQVASAEKLGGTASGKGGKRPTFVKRSRVTVILPKA